MGTASPDTLTTTDARRLLARFVDALNSGDGAALAQCMAPTYVQHNPEVPPGRDGLIAWAAMVRGSFPDFHVTTLASVAEGDMIVARHLVTGTHLGSFLGHEPTGRSFRMHTAEFFRVADGRLAEHWDVWSPQGMLMQLGIIPAGGPFRTYG